jgi:hypothetical protein
MGQKSLRLFGRVHYSHVIAGLQPNFSKSFFTGPKPGGDFSLYLLCKYPA